LEHKVDYVKVQAPVSTDVEESVVQLLVERSRENWELVSVVPALKDGFTVGYYYYFKQ